MNENTITLEEIKRLEQIGIAIADSIAADYQSCNKKAEVQNNRVHELLERFKETVESIDKENLT